MRRCLCLLALLPLGIAPAFGQMGGMGGGMPSNLHQHGAGNSGKKDGAPKPAPLKIVPEAWPRLDPGAMMCASEDALKQYQEAMETASADAPPPIPAGCTRILERTPISIVQRNGASRTQVKSSAPPVRTGWTDAWLPDKQP